MKMELAVKEKEALSFIKNEISQKYRLYWIKLVGSKARGDFDEESDLDVVILLDEVTWQIENDIFEICFFAGLRYDVLISPIVFSYEEVSNKFVQTTPFYREVEREGLLI